MIQGSTPFEGPGATCKTYFPESGHAAYKIEAYVTDQRDITKSYEL